MEKNYLRYVSAWHCGVITSPRCNVALDGESGEVICGSVRKVVGWAPGTGELLRHCNAGTVRPGRARRVSPPPGRPQQQHAWR